jgi:hypothetical protein
MFNVGKMTEVHPLEHTPRSVAAEASNYNSPTVMTRKGFGSKTNDATTHGCSSSSSHSSSHTIQHDKFENKTKSSKFTLCS